MFGFKKIVVGWLCLSLFAGCAGVGGSADVTDTTEAASDGESGLFDDGPIDLPVTIAKLESPNADYIDVSVAETSSSLNLAAAKGPALLSSAETYPITFTGTGHATDETARAIKNPTATPYVLIYANGASVVEPVNADGSFSAEVTSAIEEDIAVFAITSDDLASASASPAVIYSIDELGTVTVTITNSSRINDTMPLESDPRGNILFSIIEDDGSYTLWRRNMDGSLPDVLIQSHPNSMIRVAAMASFGDDTVNDDYTAVILDTGVDLTKVTQTESGFESSVLAEGIGEYIDSNAEDENFSSQRYWMLPADVHRVLVSRQVDFHDLGQMEASFTRVIEIYWTDGSTVATVLGETVDGARTNYRNLKIAANQDLSTVYVSVQEGNAETLDIYRLNLHFSLGEAGYETAWQAKETVIADWPYGVQAMDVDEDGNLYVLAYNRSTHGVEVGVIRDGTYTKFVDAGSSGLDVFDWIKVNSKGTLGMICGSPNSDGTENKLALVPLAGDEVGTIVDFASNSKLRTCQHIKFADERLHFFTSAGDDEPSQLSFIDLLKNEIMQRFY